MMRCAALAAALAVAHADTIKYSGVEPDGQWANPKNWDLNRLPGKGDDVYINYKFISGTKVNAAVLLSPAIGNGTVTIGSLTVGAEAQRAKLTLLVPLAVTGAVTIGGHGEIEINSGNAALSTPQGSADGTLSFMSGTLQGKFSISESGTAHFGDATPPGGAAKMFRDVQVDIKSTKEVTAGGVWQFYSSSTVTATGGVAAGGTNMAFQVADTSTGNKFEAAGFKWN